MHRHIKRVVGFGSGNYVYYWKSKRLPNEKGTAPTTADYSLSPQLSYLVVKQDYNLMGAV